MSQPMSHPIGQQHGVPYGGGARPQPANLADILERVLDKGIVIAGDVRVNLLDIELLTVKIRLLVVSVDKAAEMGIDWWRNDPSLSSQARRDELAVENERLRARIEALEASQTGVEEGDTARVEDDSRARVEDGDG